MVLRYIAPRVTFPARRYRVDPLHWIAHLVPTMVPITTTTTTTMHRRQQQQPQYHPLRIIARLSIATTTKKQPTRTFNAELPPWCFNPLTTTIPARLLLLDHHRHHLQQVPHMCINHNTNSINSINSINSSSSINNTTITTAWRRTVLRRQLTQPPIIINSNSMQ